MGLVLSIIVLLFVKLLYIIYINYYFCRNGQYVCSTKCSNNVLQNVLIMGVSKNKITHAFAMITATLPISLVMLNPLDVSRCFKRSIVFCNRASDNIAHNIQSGNL
jgi:hypothetical protein